MRAAPRESIRAFVALLPLVPLFAGCGGEDGGADASNVASSGASVASSGAGSAGGAGAGGGSSSGASGGSSSASGAGAGSACGTEDDPKNCGYCGRDCLGGACVGGACQAVELASGLSDPLDMVLALDHVYWVEHGSGTADPPFGDSRVARVPAEGGAVETVAASPLASDPPEPFFGLTGIAAYVGNSVGGTVVNKLAVVGDSGHVLAIPFGAEAPFVVRPAGSQNRPWRIAINENNFGYWTNRGSGTAPDGGLAIGKLCPGCESGYLKGNASTNPLDVLDRYFHVVAGERGKSNGRIVAFSTEDQSFYDVAAEEPFPTDLSGGSHGLAWTALDAGAVRGIDGHSASKEVVVLAEGLVSPRGMASLGSSYFVADLEGGGRILAVHHGGETRVVAAGQATPSSLLAGSGVLYWLNRGTQTGTDANGEPLFDAADGSLWRVVP